ncbi:MAG: methylmalonyl-CoA epimerase [Bacteroidota bacterium]|nr:methylmalonyl-CoA epimerase [Bacteroidota bacterium]
MNKIEHIGIAVKNLEQSNELFSKLFGKNHYKVEKVESENVSTSFFMLGETKIELLEATSPDSAISKFIEKKGEGIHHIAYDVDDVYAEMKRLQDEGFELINKEPKKGADNKLICFLHPKSTNGILVELCQEIK